MPRPAARRMMRLMDATPVPCGHSVTTAKRSGLAGWAGYGYCPSHSRWYRGAKLLVICTRDGTVTWFRCSVSRLVAGLEGRAATGRRSASIKDRLSRRTPEADGSGGCGGFGLGGLGRFGRTLALLDRQTAQCADTKEDDRQQHCLPHGGHVGEGKHVVAD